MKFINILIIVSTAFLLACSKNVAMFSAEQTTSKDLYKVDKIKRNNSWYFIYLSRNDSVFKVVTREPENQEPFLNTPKIKKHRYYDLMLYNCMVIDGVNLRSIGYMEREYMVLDSITTVGLEPEMGIMDLYYTPDLKGLYYQK